MNPHPHPVGRRVAIVGAGGIGVDPPGAVTPEVDTVVVCAGQEPRRALLAGLLAAGVPTAVVGGADVAELDAKRASDQGTREALAA